MNVVRMNPLLRSVSRFTVSFLLGISLLGFLLSASSYAGSVDSPNFIVLLTDDQSWVGTSLQIDPDDERTKSDYYQTPNIDRLAKNGMSFTRGYSPAPYCCPTRRSLLIGQTPARHIYQSDQRSWTTNYRQQLSLPQMLKEANSNYQTAHFGKWDMRFDDVTPAEMGYDVSDGYTDNGTGGGKGAGGPAAKQDPKQIFSMTDRACDFMTRQVKAGKPFFLQISHYAVHLDIFFRKQSLAAAREEKPGNKHSMPEFAAMTRDVDEGIGITLDKIKSLGIENSTYVFFLSDNGGRNTLPGQGEAKLPRNHPLRDGKGSVYEGGIRVPFLIRGPGVQPGCVSDVPVTGLDIFPTIAELAGFRPALPAALDGGSMTPVMFNRGSGKVDRNRPFLLFHQAVARSAETALMMDNLKLVKTWSKNQLELFDLSIDPSESEDLASTQIDQVDRLHALMIDFLDEVDAETRRTGTKSEVYENAKPVPLLKSKSKSPTESDGSAAPEDSAKFKSPARSNSPARSSSQVERPASDVSVVQLGASVRRKPNVLFLAIDDLNDWLGAMGGHPQAKTPNLDRLIGRSILFSNAHCAAPVCSASRHALMSGLRPSTTGWYSNSSKKLADYERTLDGVIPLPTHFKRNGYKTLAAGKVFHKGTSDVAGYDYWTEVRPRYRWPKELAARGHGYQGDKGGHFHPFPPDGGAIYQKYQRGVDGQSLCWGALAKADMPPEGMPDEQIADWAVERLKQDHQQSFFLAVGFVRPHVPYTAPKEFFDLHPLDEIVVPSVPVDEMDDIPLHGKAMAIGTINGGDHENVLSIGPDYWREMTRAYLACVSFVDAQAGKVLDALDASPYAENTIVVFWSDHGQHLGEKRHWRKQALWEESTHVPLAIRLPADEKAGEVCDRAVSLIDLYPTLLDLCELPSMPGLEGISLLPQLQNVNAPRRAPAITTWHYKNHAVRGPRWRYIRYRDGSEELYNHHQDPSEHNNVAENPKYSKIKQRLAKYLPKKNQLPSVMKDGGPDSHGRKVQTLQKEGVPDWLGAGPVPITAAVRAPAAAN